MTETDNRRRRFVNRHPEPPYDRGWPFSLLDLMRDLRYEIASRGLLRGYARWLQGQATRHDEVLAASRIAAPERARRASRSGGWGWNPFWGWRYRMGFRVPTSVAVVLGFVGFYLRLFVIAVWLLPVLALTTVLFAIVVPLALLRGALTTGLVGGLATAAGVLWFYWLLSGTVDAEVTGTDA